MKWSGKNRAEKGSHTWRGVDGVEALGDAKFGQVEAVFLFLLRKIMIIMIIITSSSTTILIN